MRPILTGIFPFIRSAFGEDYTGQRETHGALSTRRHAAGVSQEPLNRRQDYAELTRQSMLLQAPLTKGLERLPPTYTG
jgi:hypothetical protein